ncbi:energy-coupling factor transporter ATPase [Anaerotalea alkaliphila]|uniref:Energy-coupling factor transporter ATP-binding protein EcfA2 n=1 Tax=Anaerotalea alkaliphila TaxID=2662126 RepID=A0A7X5KNL2_9FIRM|nr:energy-coupling factor transporter ATPase [Anaerotalea alkaliphila]NDL68144.1 energy-coupling factor transporter ATPase [Anaerotalea alkaliphila]
MSIEIRNLHFTYGEGTPFRKEALRNVNLEIRTGEFIGLMGHTGSGKSTLIQQVNGLLKPTAGEIRIHGKDIHSKGASLKDIRQEVGLVFQYPEHQLFEMSVYKDVAFGPTNMGLSKDEIHSRVVDALDRVGLGEDMQEASPFELSGGQKRRVAIAGVLAMRPKILILDEPTAGLDPKGRDEILGEIGRIHGKGDMTVILVSHSMEDIANHVERIIVMDKGEVRMDGPPKQVFQEVEHLEAMGLGVPQVTYLAKALEAKGCGLEGTVTTVEEAMAAIRSLLGPPGPAKGGGIHD